MLCVPQSEAVATALLVPMSNTQEAKPKESRVELSLENEIKIKTQKLWPPRKVSSDFRWRLLGRQQAVGSGKREQAAPLEATAAMRLCLNLDGHVGDSF